MNRNVSAERPHPIGCNCEDQEQYRKHGEGDDKTG
jgi:hypothetical protein|tara:strand:+ start:184 stop:288 length:105 start_codon:yes stop_codon:yes gene_type:complete